MSNMIASTNRRPFIPQCPTPGSGVHSNWLMKAAWACRKAGMGAQETCNELRARITRRPNPADEIETVVRKVFSTTELLISSSYGPGPGKWPSANPEQIGAIAHTGADLADLWEASPVRLDGAIPQTAYVLQTLFPGDPLLCHGSKRTFWTKRLSEFATKAYMHEQIVPSPMISKYGRTKSGHLSQHTLAATGSRRFLVVEGDKIDGVPIPKATQSAVLMHLAEKAPLALVVDSGGKSLHGWFFCGGADEAKLKRFFAYAVSLGADSGLWLKSQFVRMPDGFRRGLGRQSVIYFNPEVLS